LSPQELAPEALILIIVHDENFLDPFDGIPVQLLIIVQRRVAILGAPTRNSDGIQQSTSIDRCSVCICGRVATWAFTYGYGGLASLGRGHTFLIHQAFLVYLHGVPVELPLQFSRFTNALFMIVSTRLTRMGL